MKISVTLSANAGVAIHIGGRRIWVDALHDQKRKGFSTLSSTLQQTMLKQEAFFEPDWICYTHCHGDHYSQRLTEAACKLWPRAKVLAPQAPVYGDEYCVEDEGLTLRFMKLPHEGEQYAAVVHYGLMISLNGCNILLPGDCEVASPALLDAVDDTPIHLMLLDFPWVTLQRGAKYLRDHFADVPKIVYHLPFAQDDTMGYRAVTQRRLSQFPQAQMLCEPFQTIVIE